MIRANDLQERLHACVGTATESSGIAVSRTGCLKQRRQQGQLDCLVLCIVEGAGTVAATVRLPVATVAGPEPNLTGTLRLPAVSVRG